MGFHRSKHIHGIFLIHILRGIRPLTAQRSATRCLRILCPNLYRPDLQNPGEQPDAWPVSSVLDATTVSTLVLTVDQMYVSKWASW